MLGWPEKTLEFHIWYLKEKNWIERAETGGVAITAIGVDEIETDGLILGKDRLLTQSTESSEDYDIIKLTEGDSLEAVGKYKNGIELH